MKKSTQNIIIAAVIALLAATAATVLAFWGLLPGLYSALSLALPVTVILLIVVFIISAFSLCQCMRRAFVALCRYGSWLVIMLILSLIFGMALLTIPELPCMFICFLIALFVQAFAFMFAVLLLANILYAMVRLGCPHCPRPCSCSNEDEDL